MELTKATNQNKKMKRKSMTNQFDELTKGLAQSVTRRAALRKFGVGLAGMALACVGLASQAKADRKPPPPCIPSGLIGAFCKKDSECCSGRCERGAYEFGGPGMCV
jgi:hypothetical protein